MKKWLIAFVIIVATTAALLLQRHESGFHHVPGETKALPPVNILPGNMDDIARAALGKKFEEKFKPAIARWCEAYEGRAPFKPEDVKVEGFTDIFNGNLYTFMVGKTTLTVKDDGDSAKVVYMMTKGGARALNSMPHDAQVPDLSVPVTRDEILQMVKADRGVTFPPNKVEIAPSGGASALGGGAMVSVNRTILNGGELMDGKSFSMVFGKDGKLVNYEGPIF